MVLPALSTQTKPPRQVGRCLLFSPIASGGMATVFLGRMQSAAGLVRTVAVKEMHPQFANNPEIVAMFLDEARLATRITHPNIVPTLDVLLEAGGLYLVMDYVPGEPLGNVLRSYRKAHRRVEPSFASAVMSDALAGLHAAHDATDEFGDPLNVVHRDVSPQNIIVGQDGVARVLDFGIAKARGRVQETTDIAVKGKLRYMAPEQLTRQPIDRRVDVFTAGIVLWEALTGKPLFESDDVGSALNAILHAPIAAPSACDERISASLDNVVLRALARDPRQRFATAQEFAEALRIAMPPATPQQVTQWLTQACGSSLQERAAVVADIEAETLGDDWPPKHLLALRTPVVTNDSRAQKTSNTTRTAVGAGLLLAAVVGTASWFVSGSNRAVIPAAAPAPTPVEVMPPQPVITPVAPVEPAVVVKAEVAQKVVVRTRRAAKPAASTKPAKAPVETKPNCEIPWVIGPNGVKTPKAGCF